jgi:hypothetical protein
MIISFSVSDFLVFRRRADLSFEEPQKPRRLASNAIDSAGTRILKTLCLYGPNNIGKTCLTRAFLFLRQTLKGEATENPSNLFTPERPSRLVICFVKDGLPYRYAFAYDALNGSFAEEELLRLPPKGSRKGKKIIFRRDYAHGSFLGLGGNEAPGLRETEPRKPLIRALPPKKSPEADEAREILGWLAEHLEVIASADVPMGKTLAKMESDPAFRRRVASFLKAADVNVGGFALKDPATQALATTYRGREVPSRAFDSLGTKKLEALAGYVIEALQEGKTLIVDELESSLHVKLTRAIVSMFNNIANKKGQLFFTTQDITLIDTERLFTPSQIWFMAKGRGGPRLYSLAEASNGAGGEENAVMRYLHGEYGALPSPRLTATLLDIAMKGEERAPKKKG